MLKETKIDLLNKTSAVVTTLGNIEVKGKQNLLNLAGCINVVEEIQAKIARESEEDTPNINNVEGE